MFKKYFFLTVIFFLLILVVWVFNVINPRNGEDLVVSIQGNTVSDLLSIKVGRVNLNDELTEIRINEIHQCGVVNWKVSGTFAKQIIIDVPKSTPQIDSIKVTIGKMCFKLSQTQLVAIIDSSKIRSAISRFAVPATVKNHKLKIPVLKNIINLPVKNIRGMGSSFIREMVLLFILYFFSRFISKFIPLINNKVDSYCNILRGGIIIGGSVLLTCIVGYSAYILTRTYNGNYPFFLDPVGNQLRFVSIYEQLMNSNRFTVILDQFRTNEINPLRGILAILFAPGLLKSQFGHMLNTLIFMLLFFVSSIYTFYKSSNNIILSFILVILFAVSPILINPRDGIGQFWQDLSAGFPLAIAGICFYNWYLYRKTTLIVLFSLFLSFAILSRFNVLFYGIFIFGAIFIYLVADLFKNKKTSFSTLIKPLTLAILILVIFCGFWVTKHLDYNLHYYNQSDSFGNTGYNPLKSGIGLFGRLLVDFRIEYLILFFVIFILSLWKYKAVTAGIFVLVWYVFSFLILWIFILGLDSMKLGKVYLIGFPIMFFSLTMIFINARINTPKFNSILVFVGCISFFIMFLNYKDFLSISENPPYNRLKEKKEIQQHVAKISNIFKHKGIKMYLYNFTDREQENLGIKLEAFYESSELIEINPVSFSSDIDTYNQPFKVPDIKKIKTTLLQEINDSLNLIIVFSDTTLVDYFFNNSYSSNISKQATKYMKTNSDWKEIGTFQTNTYSEISIFLKQ